MNIRESRLAEVYAKGRRKPHIKKVFRSYISEALWESALYNYFGSDVGERVKITSLDGTYCIFKHSVHKGRRQMRVTGSGERKLTIEERRQLK